MISSRTPEPQRCSGASEGAQAERRDGCSGSGVRAVSMSWSSSRHGRHVRTRMHLGKIGAVDSSHVQRRTDVPAARSGSRR